MLVEDRWSARRSPRRARWPRSIRPHSSGAPPLWWLREPPALVQVRSHGGQAWGGLPRAVQGICLGGDSPVSVEAFRGGTVLRCPGSDQRSWINWTLGRLKDTCRHGVGIGGGHPDRLPERRPVGGVSSLMMTAVRCPVGHPCLHMTLGFPLLGCRRRAYWPTLPSRDAPT